jgi:F-type H+-transporting ATPase subunit alpha
LKVIENGKRMTEILKQSDSNPISFERQAVILYIATKGYFASFAVEELEDFQSRVFDKLDSSYKQLAEDIKTEKALNPAIEDSINKLAKEVSANMKDK